MSRPPSRAPSAAPSRPASRAPSRAPSRPPSRAPPYMGPPMPSQHLVPPPPPGYGHQSGPLLPGPYPHPPPPHGMGPPVHSQIALQQPRGPLKRLIATCDGTWLDSDSGLKDNGQAQPPSNVSRFGWAVKETSSTGIPQIVHYNAGVGSQGGKITKAISGLTGIGLEDNVRETYSFLAVNYAPGDEIFLLGFSRGAWTARSVGGVIGGVGLLTREGMPFFSAIYADWEHRHDLKYISKQPDLPFPNKPPFRDPSYATELERLGFTRRNIPIKAIGVWDTVGSLGIPRIGLFESLGIQGPNVHQYSFYDTSLGENVENAFQALALDEHRAPFSPSLWEKPKNSRTNLKQVWFPGVHSNVGGGYDDSDLANITLAWMISRLEPFLEFRPDYVLHQADLNRQYYKAIHERPRPWSFGLIPNSLKGVYGVTGSKTRTPGNYYRVDPFTARTTDERMKHTNEFIHPSVRARTALRGPGIADRGRYLCKALRDWDIVSIPRPGQEAPLIVWRKREESIRNPEEQDEIPEASLLPTEARLLGLSPKVEPFILGMQVKLPRRRREKPTEVEQRDRERDRDRDRDRSRATRDREKDRDRKEARRRRR